MLSTSCSSCKRDGEKFASKLFYEGKFEGSHGGRVVKN